MTTNPPTGRWFLAGALLAFVFAAIFATWEFSRVCSAVAQEAKSAAEQDSLQKEVATLEAKLRRRNMLRTEAQPLPGSTPAQTDTVPASDPAAPTPKSIAALRAEARKAEARSLFGPLFQALGLPPEKIAAISECFALHQSNRDKLFTEIPSGTPLNANDRAMLSLKDRIDEEDARYLTAIADILGPEDFRRFEQFQRETRFWSQANALAIQLYATEAPLTAPQARQLVDALAASAVDTSGRPTATVSSWAAMLDRAAGFLSPPQLAVFEAIHEHDDTWRQLSRLSGKARAANNPGPGQPLKN